MSYLLHPRITARIAEIEQAGGDCSDFGWILRRLSAGENIPERFNHHPLRGKLAGLSSVIVGHTDEGLSVVMVYQLVRRRIAVTCVDEHDAAYSTLRKERATTSAGGPTKAEWLASPLESAKAGANGAFSELP